MASKAPKDQSDEEEGEEEEEDDLAVFLSDDIDERIQDTLHALRTGDKRIYDASYSFMEDGSGDDDQSEPTSKKKKTEKKWVKQCEDSKDDEFLRKFFTDKYWTVHDDSTAKEMGIDVHRHYAGLTAEQLDKQLDDTGEGKKKKKTSATDDDDDDDWEIALQNQHEWEHNRAHGIEHLTSLEAGEAEEEMDELSSDTKRFLADGTDDDIDGDDDDGEEKCFADKDKPCEVMPVERLTKPISGKRFWRKYVKARKPVLISGEAVPEMMRNFDFWKQWRSDEYLKKRCGREVVRVEMRAGHDKKFGVPSKTLLDMSTFLDECCIQESDDDATESDFYLSVQDIPSITTGRFAGAPQSLLGAPLQALADDFPKRLPDVLCGDALITHQINLWMGHSVRGTSSKLHHDFHDNFYCVVRGTKSFELFPPECIESLYVNGTVKHRFENGFVTYQGCDVDYREDGAVVGVAAKTDAKEVEYMDDMETMMLGAGDDGDVDEDMDLEAMFDEMPSEYSSMDDEEGSDLFSASFGLKDETKSDPPSFCRIDLKKTDEEIIAEFPAFEKVRHLRSRAILQAGDMLYLPCGWFHEVTSISDPELRSHLALSYWLYPPCGKYKRPKPYTDNLWKEWFDSVSSSK